MVRYLLVGHGGIGAEDRSLRVARGPVSPAVDMVAQEDKEMVRNGALQKEELFCDGYLRRRERVIDKDSRGSSQLYGVVGWLEVTEGDGKQSRCLGRCRKMSTKTSRGRKTETAGTDDGNRGSQVVLNLGGMATG